MRVHLPEGPVKVDCSDFESLLDHTTAKNGHLQLRSGLFNGVDYCACPPDKHVAVAASRRLGAVTKHLQLEALLQCPGFIDELFPHRLQLHNTRFIYSLPWYTNSDPSRNLQTRPEKSPIKMTCTPV